MTDHEAPITPEFPPKSEFRKWLRSLPADEVVAEDFWGCFTCPIATWLLMTGIADQPYVRPAYGMTPGVWSPAACMPLSPLPEWANKFGALVDERFDDCNTDGFRPVTASDCLRALSRTPRG